MIMYRSRGTHDADDMHMKMAVRQNVIILQKIFIVWVVRQSICTKVAVFQIKISIFAGLYINIRTEIKNES